MAVGALVTSCLLACSPLAAQLPRTYEASRVAQAPTIDGALDDAAWQNVPWTDEFVDIRGEGWPAPTLSTRAKMVWDEGHLYIGAALEEPHLWATLLERDAIIYRDNDFEVFLDPDGDGLDYYELEINALGTEFDLFLAMPYHLGGDADIAWDMPSLRTGVSLYGSLNDPSDVDQGWGVEIAIAWEDLRPPGGEAVDAPSAGDTWRVNFSRVQWPLLVEAGRYRKVREPKDWTDHPEDNWVWSPQGVIDMHRPEMWGIVRFVERR